MFDYGTDHRIPYIKMNDAFMGQIDFLGCALYLRSFIQGYFHPQSNPFLLPILFESNYMLTGMMTFDVNGRTIELLSPKFLYFFNLMFKTFIVVLTKHILEFIIKILLSILNIYFKRITIKRIGIRIRQFFRL